MDFANFDLAALLPYIAIGFAAQLVDGALGMAFGVISNALMVGVLGVAEMARIDAATGAAELGEGLAALLPGHDPQQLAALTEILSAGFDRAALKIAEGAPPAPYIAALLGLIAGLDQPG